MATENPWSTRWNNSPPQQDEPLTTYQPTLTDDTSPGAGDGDRFLASHINTMRDKTNKVANLTGLPALWEWNGADLTQFGTKVEGSVLSTSTVTVETSLGFNTVSLYMDGSATPDSERMENALLVPLLGTFTGNYMIMADCYWAYNGAASRHGPLLAVWMGTNSAFDNHPGLVFEWPKAAPSAELVKVESGPASDHLTDVQMPTVPSGGPGGMRLGLGVFGNDSGFMAQAMGTHHQFFPSSSKSSNFDEGRPALGLIGEPGVDWSGTHTRVDFWNIKVWPLPRPLSVF